VIPEALVKSTILFVLTLIAQNALATNTTPLFSKGDEIFKFENAKGQQPVFRILDDSMTEKALAVAAIATLNTQGHVEPKIPMQDYIDLKFQTLKFSPPKRDSKQVDLSVKVSGYEIWLGKSIQRADFLSGKTLTVPFPTGDRTVAMFDVKANGNLKFRLDPKTNIVILDNVQADMSFTAPVGDGGSEAIRFSGRAIRQ
jgi:hypothetical protein